MHFHPTLNTLVVFEACDTLQNEQAEISLKRRPSVSNPVRDRVRSKMERDILAEVNHPFIVKLHYGEHALLY